MFKGENRKTFRALFLVILVHFLFFLLRPISLHTDGIGRHLINAEQVLNGNLAFHTWPFLSFILAGVKGIFMNSEILFYFFKLPSFLAFLGSLYFVILISRRIKLKENYVALMILLFSFSSWILLIASSVGQDMIFVFFTLMAFWLLDRYLIEPKIKTLILLFLSSIGLTLIKQPAIFVFIGFSLYTLFSKTEIRIKFKSILSMFLGSLSIIPWLVKNYFSTGGLANGLPSEIARKVIPVVTYSSFWNKLNVMFHYFWEFPLIGKTGLEENVLFLFYHYVAFIVFLAFTLAIVYSLFMKAKRCYKLIWLVVPLLLFSLIYMPCFNYFKIASDVGRYSLPILFFLYIPFLDLVQSSGKKIKTIFVLLIIGFSFVSLVSAGGILYNIREIDNQIIEISGEFKLEYPHEFTVGNPNGFEYWNVTFFTNGQDNQLIFIENTSQQSYKSIVTNKEFDQVTLAYYSRRTVYLDESMEVCEGDLVYLSNEIKITETESSFFVCRL